MAGYLIDINSVSRKFNSMLKMQQCKRVLVMTGSISILILIFGACFIRAKGFVSHKYEKFTAQESHLIALENLVDKTVDPCSNFYKFACGHWAKTVPSNKPRVTSFSIQQDTVDKKVGQIIKNARISKNYPHVVNSAIQFYNICTNAPDENDEDVNGLLNYFEQIGGWPILTCRSWDENKFSWVNASSFIFKTLGIETVFGIHTTIYDKNTSKNVFYVTAPHLPDIAFIGDTPFIMLYSAINALNSSCSDANELWMEMETIKGTENKWREYFAKRNSSDKRKTTFKQLSEEIPEFDWLNYFKLIADDALVKINSTIYENDIIIVEDFGFFKQAVEVLSSGIFTNREIANLYGWFIVQNLFMMIPGAYNQYAAIYNLDTVEKKDDIESKCRDAVLDLYSTSVDYLIVANTYTHDFQHSKILIDYIKRAFKSLIFGAKWLDDATKKRALHKLQAMQSVVGYPKYYKDSEFYNKMYLNLPNLTSDILEVYIHMKTYKLSLDIFSLKIANDKNTWVLPRPITHVSAYYDVNRNVIVFPLSLHYPPFYYTLGPWFLNFGAIGSIIGHEIMHGFDSLGCTRDEDGNLHNWWTDVSSKNYENQSECFVRQYSSYNYPIALSSNGSLTLGENIADSEGLRAAYIAYKQWELDRGSKESNNELMTYSAEQMFFIAFGSMWCHKIEPYMRNLMSKDSHSSPEIRVTGSVSNSEYFAKAFHCNKGSPMNPEKKCMLW